MVSNKMEPSQKKFNAEGYIGSVVGISFLAILSAILMPNFKHIDSPIRPSNGVKEAFSRRFKDCFARYQAGLSTSFSDIQTKKDTYHPYKEYVIVKNLDIKAGKTCFAALAVPVEEIDKYTWFEFQYNPKTKQTIKRCGDSSKYGCDEGNTW